LKRVYRLAGDVQVRKESWGLLFYSRDRHRLFFVRSGGWLYPHHFDGRWDTASLISDIAGRTGSPAGVVEKSILKLAGNLVENGVITHELC